MVKAATRIGLYLIATCWVICSCDNYTLSEEQAERFVRYYPTDFFNYCEGTDIIQIHDGGYLVSANTSQTSGTISDREIMIIMTDKYGMETDQSLILTGTSGHNFGYMMVPVGDGYVIAGSSKQDENTYGFLVKINLAGEMVFNHIYGETPLQEFLGITASSDGGFILTGYSRETNGDRQVYLVKTDSWGLTVWERVIGFIGYNDIGETVIEHNGRIIIVGTTTPVNAASGNSRLVILNTNSEGKGMTEHRISVDGNLSGADMVVDNDENIIILGNQSDPISGISALYLARIRLEGFNNELITVTDATSVGFPESLYGVSMVVNNNELAICGWQDKQDDQDILLARFDLDFNLKDIQIFGSVGYQSGSGICITTDGAYAITGGAEVAGYINTVLIKLGPDGRLY